ncbi:UBX domain-containing protein 7 [Porphyridium purpureum]|uniref:UBX domain-containing protein 7 n=1 Tax=Porphyridium purpureum TaxID=35688 RepID=A0A5J4YNC7_PORPP|nr:UBX domain-containing protein 7 [Porphyridium purpureum]|eukprot:POR1695..scf249_10
MSVSMSAADAEVVAQFMSITGVTSEDYAKDMLNAAGLDLEQSLAQHFAIQDAGGGVPHDAAPAAGPRAAHSDAQHHEGAPQEEADLDAALAASLAEEQGAGASIAQSDSAVTAGNVSRRGQRQRARRPSLPGDRDATGVGALDSDFVRPPMQQRVQRLVDNVPESAHSASERMALRHGFSAAFDIHADEPPVSRQSPPGPALGLPDRSGSAAQQARSRLMAPLPSFRDRAATAVVSDADGVFNPLAQAQAHAQAQAESLAPNERRFTSSLTNMYRPPSQMLFYGSLERALEAGQRDRKWVLVNIQGHDDFRSHVLNSDVWNDETVQELVKASFLLWQRYSVSADGEQYRTYYPFSCLPHVALLDPRSGERLVEWNSSGVEDMDSLSKSALLENLMEFLDSHSLEGNATGPAHRRRSNALRKRAADAAAAADVVASQSASHGAANHFSDHDVLMDEDAQMAAAIAASLEQTAAPLSSSVEIDVDAMDESEESGDAVAVTSATLNAAPAVGANAHSSAASAFDYGPPRYVPPPQGNLDPVLREARDIRREQDEEYAMALAMDRSREENAREAEERARLESMQRERALNEQEVRKQTKRAEVPLEPPPASSGSGGTVTQLAVRMLDGSRRLRRFEARNTVRNVYDFVISETGLEESEFDLVSGFPQKVLPATHQLTLEQAGLVPNGLLTVRKR